MDASENQCKKTQCKGSVDATKEQYLKSPVTHGKEKLSGRDHEFREPTQRREQTEGIEDFSGELQGEPEGFQPTESRDDAEARSR